MATELNGNVNILRINELQDVNPASIRTKYLILDLDTDTDSLRVLFTVLEAAIKHNNLTEIQQAGTGVTNGHISDASQTITGQKTFENKIIETITIVNTNISTSYNLDFANNKEYQLTLTADTEITVSNAVIGDVQFLTVTGNFNLTFGSEFTLLNGKVYDRTKGAYVGIMCVDTNKYNVVIQDLS